MQKIAVLGPKNTYTDIACKKYLKESNLNYEIEYFPNIISTACAAKNTDIAILPFENSLDGFVMESLDYIINNNFHIVSQLKLDIDFAFVSNNNDITKIKNCYVQAKAYGQCLNFLTQYNFDIIRTQSNAESYEKIVDADDSYCAIIPMHFLENKKFNLEQKHIADSNYNQTRFFIVEDKMKFANYNCKDEDVESSIVVIAKEDKPGILFNILKEISLLDINLKSIVSRPLKTQMGKYKFYLECSLKKENVSKLDMLTKKLNKSNYIVNVLGIYNKL